ncbi:S-layer homology domain-containing protein [Peptococcus simiae]|uniref:S-layer homology domain-containing protein n=1 Tax=Peptococcus simiae TaxID=1643805 RepID=A0ABW9H0G5_9FIRM
MMNTGIFKKAVAILVTLGLLLTVLPLPARSAEAERTLTVQTKRFQNGDMELTVRKADGGSFSEDSKVYVPNYETKSDHDLMVNDQGKILLKNGQLPARQAGEGVSDLVIVEKNTPYSSPFATPYRKEFTLMELSVWQGDAVNYSKGVILEEADQDGARIEDAGNRTTEKEGTYEGPLAVTFKDGSQARLDGHKLTVVRNKIDGKEAANKLMPEGACYVTFVPGEGVSADFQGKTILVKPGTVLTDADFPVVKSATGYDAPVWSRENRTITGNTTFFASASQKGYSQRPVVTGGRTEKDTLIQGTGTPGAVITFQLRKKDDDQYEALPGQVTVAAQGKFTYLVPQGLLLRAGDDLKVIQEEKGKKPMSVNHQITPAIPGQEATATPENLQVDKDGKTVRGQGVAGATVDLYVYRQGKAGQGQPRQAYYSARSLVDPQGKFTFTLPEGKGLEKGDLLRFVQKEAEKDFSNEKELTYTVKNKSNSESSAGGGSTGPSLPNKKKDHADTSKPGMNKDKNKSESKPKEKGKQNDNDTAAQMPSLPSVNRQEAYVSGYPDGSFQPDQAISRAEAAAMFARSYLRDRAITQQLPLFKDIAYTGAWYENAIISMVNTHMMSGYPDQTFRPHAPISRAEFAAILSRNEKGPVSPAPFTDLTGHWAKEAISQAYAKKYLNGYPDGTFRPDAPITRAEACAMVNRFLGRKPLPAQEKQTTTFKDLPTSHWAYDQVMTAAHTHSLDQTKTDAQKTGSSAPAQDPKEKPHKQKAA